MGLGRGGGTDQQRADLEPWPNWSQLGNWDAGFLSNINATNNCGPESVAEVVKYLTGVRLSAAYIKDRMYNAQYTGYTDFIHLQTFLQECEIPSQLVVTGDHLRGLGVATSEMDKGHPSIVLFYSNLDNGGSGGHFCPVHAYGGADNDPQSWWITRSNVWNAREERMGLSAWRQWYHRDGGVLVVKRKRW